VSDPGTPELPPEGPAPPPTPPPGYPAPPDYFGASPGYQAPGYPPPGYPDPGFQTPGYAGYPSYYPTRKTSGEAIGALVLALVSWVICPVIPAIVALVLAGRADAEIKAGGGWVDGAGMVTAARVLSWIHLGLAAVGLVFLVALLALGTVTSDTGGGVGI
jgi:hypothetical protein